MLVYFNWSYKSVDKNLLLASRTVQVEYWVKLLRSDVKKDNDFFFNIGSHDIWYLDTGSRLPVIKEHSGVMEIKAQ